MTTLANFDLWGSVTPKQKQIKKKVHKPRKAIRCITTDQVFISTTEAGNHFGLCVHEIWKSCYKKTYIWSGENVKLYFEFIEEL